MENSTIAAIATTGGRGGIGIIKISGSTFIDVLIIKEKDIKEMELFLIYLYYFKFSFINI